MLWNVVTAKLPDLSAQVINAFNKPKLVVSETFGVVLMTPKQFLLNLQS